MHLKRHVIIYKIWLSDLISQHGFHQQQKSRNSHAKTTKSKYQTSIMYPLLLTIIIYKSNNITSWNPDHTYMLT